MFKRILNAMVDPSDPDRSIKLGIWLYFLLIIFEGAIRKWLLPMLATPLLVIRDPVALWIIVKLMRQRRFPGNIYLTVLVVLNFICIYTAVFLGHGNFYVAVYGARIFFVHFPMIYIIQYIFDRKDVLKMGRAFLYISIPMAVLTAFQFYSPQTAWVNKGVGDDASAGFAGANGFFRPPGTFSFTVGNTIFFSIAACFLFYYWVFPGLNKWVRYAVTSGLLMSVPLSISRSLVFSIGVTFIFLLFGISRTPKYLRAFGGILLGGFFLIIILSQFTFFNTATDALTTRFTNAGAAEGGVEGTLLNRYFGGLLSTFSNANQVPFWGVGLGALSSVGSKLLSGQVVNAISEGEWSRMIGEMGLVMGFIVIIIRLIISFQMTVESFGQLRQGNLIPWLLLSFVLVTLPQGNLTQPSALGFTVLVAGLLLASLKEPIISKRPVV